MGDITTIILCFAGSAELELPCTIVGEIECRRDLDAKRSQRRQAANGSPVPRDTSILTEQLIQSLVAL